MALAKKALPATDTALPKYTRGDIIGGKYRLVRLLGEGGTSWVWVAENMDLEVEVAMKLIRTDLEDQTIGERLLGEARSIARLGHPAIVQVFDFGRTEQDDRYIVMELLKGESLSQRLNRLGPIPPEEVVQSLLPVIDALHAAHNEGIVHRDLKPDNIMVADAEKGFQPKLLDFGIAKFSDADGIKDSKLTQVGVVVGTPSYMSPEQARGDQDLDARSDIFALSTVMYECLTKQLPFQGDVYNAVMWSIIQDEPKPLKELGVDDLQLGYIVHKGLQKNREDRWQSAKELGEALAAWLEERGVHEDLSGRSLRSSWTPNRNSLMPVESLAPTVSVETEEEDERSSLRPFSAVSWSSTPASRRWAFVGVIGLLMLLIWLLASPGDDEAKAVVKDVSLEPLKEDHSALGSASKQQVGSLGQSWDELAKDTPVNGAKAEATASPPPSTGTPSTATSTGRPEQPAAAKVDSAPRKATTSVRQQGSKKPAGKPKDERFDFGF